MKTRTMIMSGIAALGFIGLSGQAHAAAASCYGTLYGAFTDKNGNIYINGSWRQNWTQICNLNSEWRDVPTQTCWSWFSQVNSAVAQSKHVRVYYVDGTSATCDQLLTYGASPSPQYVMLID